MDESIIVPSLSGFPQFAQKVGQSLLSSLNPDELFQKNATCSGLTSGITKGLTKNEVFEFIFYSPKLNECVYSISKKEDSLLRGYKNIKVLLSGSTQKELGEYIVYYSYDFKDYLETEKSVLDVRTRTGKREYVNFILDNSYYKFDLLKGVSDLGGYF